MNKLFSKIAALSVGLAMAIGVGVAVGSRSEARVQAAGTDATQYSLITSTSDLETGKSYIITNGTSGTVKAMSSESNNDNRRAVDATVSGGKITRGSSILSLTLEASGSDYKLKTENYAGTAGYLASAASGNNNKCYVSSNGGTVTISFSGQKAVINIGPHATRKLLRYNTSGLFACYGSGQNDVYLWKEAGAATSFTVTYSANGATSGTVPVDSNTYSAGDKATVLDNTGNLVKDGYTFAGWTYGDNVYQAGDKIDISTSITLSAKWYKNDTIVPKEASFNIYNGGTLVLSTCVTADGDGVLSFDVPEANYLTYNAESLTVTADASNKGGPLTVTAHKGLASCTFDLNVIERPAIVSLSNIGANLGSSESATLQTTDVADEYTSEAYTLNYVQCKKQTDGTSSGIFMKKSVDAFISNKTEMPGTIESVKVYTCSGAAAATSYDVAFGTSEFTEATAGIGAVVIGKGSSYVYENNVANAKFFCITLGNANNGQVLKIEIVYQSVDPSKKDMTIYTSNHTADGSSLLWGGAEDLYLFTAKEDSTSLTDVTWSVSDETVATINETTGRLTCVKPGNVTVYAEKDGYNKASAAISIIKGSLEELVVSGEMTKKEYLVGESWNPAGLVATATYHSSWEEDVSSAVEWTFDPSAPALNVTSVIATATLDEISSSSSAQSVTVTKSNQIQVLYTKSNSDPVDVYGYYVGFLDGTGPVIMDGDYGIVIYKKDADVSSYTEGETILHVTGSISIYNGLYEIASPTMTVVTSVPEISVPSTPVVYATKGGETQEYASRLTTLTGKVKSVTINTPKGKDPVAAEDYDWDPAAEDRRDATIVMTVGSIDVQVFYKKAAQTLVDGNKIMAALSSQEELTVKGFTGWFNGFQVQMNGIIEAIATYTAEDFSADLLAQTDAVCVNYVDGKSSYSEFKAALTAIWSDLASNDKYPSLPSDQKTILAEAERVESGTVIERAMARYDFLTGKYELNNFINGRTPVQAFIGSLAINETTDNNTMIIIITIAAVSAFAFTSLLVIKKKKHN